MTRRRRAPARHDAIDQLSERRSVQSAFLCTPALVFNLPPRSAFKPALDAATSMPPKRERRRRGARDHGRGISRRGLFRWALRPTKPSKEASPQSRLRIALSPRLLDPLLDQKLDATRDARGPPYEAGAFEGKHHLVHAGRPPRGRDRCMAGPAKPNRRPHRLDVLRRQSQNQNGARLSQSLAQRVIITVHTGTFDVDNSCRLPLSDDRWTALRLRC